eukprot:CAMPEP_0180542884 /NCGR_PEP_ID=MMETSP1036_2-20121128/68690_1 /TAXON_ID=632150 /ORGANISM="Azadinium spinosum, Strain 3D9" /LENGTH=64 /DNA_ID=CAMNT_0022557781 /DNA_START=314 /DNA_END=508 /DNA_ORIENTATION=+
MTSPVRRRSKAFPVPIKCAVLCDEATLRENDPDLRILGGEAEVASEGEAEADAYTTTVDARDHR